MIKLTLKQGLYVEKVFKSCKTQEQKIVCCQWVSDLRRKNRVEIWLSIEFYSRILESINDKGIQ